MSHVWPFCSSSSFPFWSFGFSRAAPPQGGEGREGVFLHARGLCQKPAKVLFAEKQSGGFLVQVWPISHKVPFCAVVQKAANIHREHRQASHQMDRKNRRRIIINLQIYSLERARLCRVFLHQSRDFTKKRNTADVCIDTATFIRLLWHLPPLAFPHMHRSKNQFFPGARKKRRCNMRQSAESLFLSRQNSGKKSRFLLRNKTVEKVQIVFISAKVCGR